MNKSKLVSNTQIYLDCRKLLDEILDITPNFPRAYKFSVGSKMHDIGVNLISEISAAYINRDRQTRIQHLVNFQSQFEVLKTLLRIAGERKWILGRSSAAAIRVRHRINTGTGKTLAGKAGSVQERTHGIPEHRI